MEATFWDTKVVTWKAWKHSWKCIRITPRRTGHARRCIYEAVEWKPTCCSTADTAQLQRQICYKNRHNFFMKCSSTIVVWTTIRHVYWNRCDCAFTVQISWEYWDIMDRPGSISQVGNLLSSIQFWQRGTTNVLALSCTLLHNSRPTDRMEGCQR